jgi:hypothetical protein
MNLKDHLRKIHNEGSGIPGISLNSRFIISNVRYNKQLMNVDLIAFGKNMPVNVITMRRKMGN